LLELLVEVRKRHQRQRMARGEIDRELQIGESEVLAALTPKRGAEPEQHFRRSGLRRIDQGTQPLAVLDVVHRFGDQRVVRQHLVERFVDLERFVLAEVARGPPAVCFDGAQRVCVELVDTLEPLAGLLLVAGNIENQSGVWSLTTAYHSGPVSRSMLS